MPLFRGKNVLFYGTMHHLPVALLLSALVGGPVFAQGENRAEPVISPPIERRNIKLPRIDTENFEVGGYYGLFSAEDFGSESLAGVRMDYHMTEDFFVEAGVAQTKVSDRAFSLNGLFLFPKRTEDLTFYELSLGYNLLPGEVFLGSRYAFTSAFYVIGGMGNSHFIDEDRLTTNFGFGLRLLLTDWLAVHIDSRDYMFESDIVGEKKLTHNFTLNSGLTLFF